MGKVKKTPIHPEREVNFIWTNDPFEMFITLFFYISCFESDKVIETLGQTG